MRLCTLQNYYAPVQAPLTFGPVAYTVRNMRGGIPQGPSTDVIARVRLCKMRCSTFNKLPTPTHH